jgi:VIT1/CCC1 family predicted Fe2+/Mn2+ transporter
MALGEYVSVSSQRDSQRTEIAQEKRELAATPEAELTELTALYEAKGLSAATARTVAAELTAHGAPAAHLDAELHIDPEDIPSAVQAAAASALSFTSGALLPLLAILLPPASAASGTYSAPPSADANRAPGASRRKCQRPMTRLPPSPCRRCAPPPGQWLI